MAHPLDEKNQREREEKKAVAELDVARAYYKNALKKTLATPEGLDVLYRILDFSGVWTSTMKTSSEIYFRAGASSVGFELLEQIQKNCPEFYSKIIDYKIQQEAKENK